MSDIITFNCTVKDLDEVIQYLIDKRRKEHRSTVMSKFKTIEECENKRNKLNNNIEQLEDSQRILDMIYGGIDTTDILTITITNEVDEYD